MDRLEADFPSLLALIGRKVSWRGGVGIVVEILEDGPAIVVQADDFLIQSDSHGYPRRRTRETILIQVFNSDCTDYTEEFLDITR